MTVFVFPDTNIWLHFRPLDQVDWNEAFLDDDVQFVATDPLVRELDNLKFGTRTRDRSRAALAKIESWAGAAEAGVVRPGVTGLFWAPDLIPDVAALGLDPHHPDDVLVAYAHKFKNSHSGARVVLLSDDSGPRLTARRVGLEPMAPPDAAREPALLESPEETELRRLRREIEALKNRLPRISLAFKGGTVNGDRIEVSRGDTAVISQEDYVRQILEEGRHQVPVIVSPSASGKSGGPPNNSKRSTDLSELAAQLSTLGSPFFSIDASEYARYASDRERYFKELELVAVANWSILEEQTRTVAVNILLLNDGNAPADDVDIDIHIPDGPVVRDKDARLSKLPERPVGPRNFNQVMAESLNYSVHPFGPSFPSIRDLPNLGSKSNVSPPTIRRTKSYSVKVHVERIKQHQRLAVAHLVLIFPRGTGTNSLTVSYSLNSVSTPNPVTGSLHIVVRK